MSNLSCFQSQTWPVWHVTKPVGVMPPHNNVQFSPQTEQNHPNITSSICFSYSNCTIKVILYIYKHKCNNFYKVKKWHVQLQSSNELWISLQVAYQKYIYRIIENAVKDPQKPLNQTMKLILGWIPIMLEPMPLGPKIMSNCELSNPTILFR